jgi:hypothetical protein
MIRCMFPVIRWSTIPLTCYMRYVNMSQQTTAPDPRQVEKSENKTNSRTFAFNYADGCDYGKLLVTLCIELYTHGVAID